jgi:hypothetical protein
VDAFEIGVLLVVAMAVLGCCLAARVSGRRRVRDFGTRRGAVAASDAAQHERDDEDLRDMLAVTNARRRARGLPERTVADAIREFGQD